MNLHEYQGKELLKSYGVAIQEGIVATNIEEAKNAYKEISEKTNSKIAVVKAQIHAGGKFKLGHWNCVLNMIVFWRSTDGCVQQFQSLSLLLAHKG